MAPKATPKLRNELEKAVASSLLEETQASCSPQGQRSQQESQALAYCKYCLSKHTGEVSSCAGVSWCSSTPHGYPFSELELHRATCNWDGAIWISGKCCGPQQGAGTRRLPLRRGTPPAPLAARGSHSNTEMDHGKALTMDTPMVEAFDNPGVPV